MSFLWSEWLEDGVIKYGASEATRSESIIPLRDTLSISMIWMGDLGTGPWEANFPEGTVFTDADYDELAKLGYTKPDPIINPIPATITRTPEPVIETVTTFTDDRLDIIEAINEFSLRIQKYGRKLSKLSRKISINPTERRIAKFERVENKLIATSDKREDLFDTLIDIVSVPDFL